MDALFEEGFVVRILQHAEVTRVIEDHQLRMRNRASQVLRVRAQNRLIVRAIRNGGPHGDVLQLLRRPVRLVRPHRLNLLEKA